MTIVFLFARVFLGALLMYQGVKLLDPYARQVSIANLRGAGVKGSYLAFISADDADWWCLHCHGSRCGRWRYYGHHLPDRVSCGNASVLACA